mgnify:CR=1 FL=1
MVKLAIHLKTNKMILIFVLIYIGVSFHSLAEKFKKTAWIYIVIGIITYLLATFITGVLIGLVFFAIDKDIHSINNFILELIGVPFALIACYGLRVFLSNKWKKQKIIPSDDILDDIIIDN